MTSSNFVPAEDLQEEFELFGVDINDDVITKFQELCCVYRLDAATVTAEWVAFSKSKENAEPTCERIDVFARERLSKRIRPGVQTPSKGQHNDSSHNIDTLQELIDAADAEKLYSVYSTPATKGMTPNPKKRQQTPENVAQPLSKRVPGVSRSPAVPFSPASFSPASVTPSQKYGRRTNAGEVLLKWGPELTKTRSKDAEEWTCPVSVYQSTSTKALTQSFKYMFQKLTDKADILNDQIEDMALCLQKQHNIEDWHHVLMPAQEDVSVVGRICCDSIGRLNSKSVLLEGSRESSAGRRVPVDFSQLSTYALFPGQVVAMTGNNPLGQKFITKSIYGGVPALPTKERPVSQRTDPLQVMIATGPFTTSDNLSYEPLADFMKYLHRDRPHVCIMLGPFVDMKNEEIEKGSLNVTYQEHFQAQMEHLIRATQSIDCQLVVVPSFRDIHHDFVYPQPPFRLTLKDKQNVHFVSDPCTLWIDDYVFGMTSTDVLLHLGAEEIAAPPGSSDRLGRLTKHLLTQTSYYPLYPGADDLNIDYDQAEVHCKMPVTPDVLIIPSDLKFFIKDVLGCCCINPSRLAKGHAGGTYTHLSLPVRGDKSSIKSSNDISTHVIRV